MGDLMENRLRDGPSVRPLNIGPRELDHGLSADVSVAGQPAAAARVIEHRAAAHLTDRHMAGQYAAIGPYSRRAHRP